MRALVVVLLALGACKSTQNPSPCSVDVEATGDTGVSYIACGSFTVGDPNYTDEAMVAAQACVLNAIAQSTSYLLLYDAAADQSGDVTGELRAGWVGSIQPGNQLLSRTYAGEGRSGDMSMKSVSETTCATVEATASCTPHVGVPCLACTALGESSIVCRD